MTSHPLPRLEEIEPFTVTYTDFTEISYANGQRKAYFTPLLGHRSKMVSAGS